MGIYRWLEGEIFEKSWEVNFTRLATHNFGFFLSIDVRVDYRRTFSTVFYSECCREEDVYIPVSFFGRRERLELHSVEYFGNR